MTIDELCDVILGRSMRAGRSMIAIAGPPGSGKSTLAERLALRLSERGETAEVLPMDGFHMDNGLLQDRGLLARKGAPQTFDLRGFADVLKAVKAGEEEVLVPVFDRSRELAIAAARVVSPDHRFIIVEGNYLLLGEGGWQRLRPYFDFAVMLAPPIEELEKRLLARWHYYGLSGEALDAKMYGNDLPNVRLVLERSSGADLVLESCDLEPASE
ncbi:nucleoside triphosphate hydrolase [Neorhizobium alkalisoli]|uniref:AAA domain-containing protein n=1 Tax=Neorhizobium alkalisoli TaxID=528178 RepID=A0A561QVR0_9HYPH|nr:nucleoside triphosphate hydrolase [Neorhizobium alkalisoli]TWF54460.1 AAA domain-containing protein [Neorhizobium alkalisoli]